MEKMYKEKGFAGMQEEYMKQIQMSMANAQKAMDQVAGKMSGLLFSMADELTKLGKLKEPGVISESQFQQMEQELIKKMT